MGQKGGDYNAFSQGKNEICLENIPKQETTVSSFNISDNILKASDYISVTLQPLRPYIT